MKDISVLLGRVKFDQEADSFHPAPLFAETTITQKTHCNPKPALDQAEAQALPHRPREGR